MEDFEKGVMLTTFLLIINPSHVFGQALVEFLNQPSATTPVLSTGSFIQTSPQLVVPTLVKPIVQPCESYIQEFVPSVPNFNSFGGFPGYGPPSFGMPGVSPTIIIDSDDDDNNWRNLLYILIFAMKNRRNNRLGGGWGGCDGCWGGCDGGWCGGGCGSVCSGNCCGVGFGNCCACDGNCGNNGYCGNNNGGISYVPYPIAIPVPSVPYYGYGGSGSDNSGGKGADEGHNSLPNEVNIIITTTNSTT